MSIEEHMELYLGQGMDKKSAMKQVAKDRGVGKEIFTRHFYRLFVNLYRKREKIVQLGHYPG